MASFVYVVLVAVIALGGLIAVVAVVALVLGAPRADQAPGTVRRAVPTAPDLSTGGAAAKPAEPDPVAEPAPTTSPNSAAGDQSLDDA